jgi:CheY-like chemotaxis protein
MPRLLVVDDDPDSRDAICKFLEQAGYETICASNGWEGLLALDHGPIDVIIADMFMPGMDGLTFLKIIANDTRRAKIPVIVISAFDPFGDLNLQRIVAHAFVPKATDNFYERLMELVGGLLGTKPNQPKKR